MTTLQLDRPASAPRPTIDRFWRTVFSPLRIEPAIARLEPSRFGSYAPLRAA